MSGKTVPKLVLVHPFQQQIREEGHDIVRSISDWQEHARSNSLLVDEQQQPWETKENFNARTSSKTFEVWEKANADKYAKSNRGNSI